MKREKWAAGLACALLAAVAVIGATMAWASQGSQSNPLVTLSYLNEAVVPEILRQVDEKVEAKADELKREVMAESQGVFVAVEVPAGKSVTLSAGAQVLARSGKLLSPDALVDTTAGTIWNGEGTGMVANHLYMATGDGQRLTASTASTIMVQGSYTLG